VDAVIVSGDVYNRSLPSVEATNLFNDFLESFVKLEIPLYIVSGNHDSVDRLSFGSEIFKHKNIYITRPYDGVIQKESVMDEYGEVNFYLMPFVNAINVKAVHKDLEDSADLTETFEYILKQANVDTTQRNVFVGHQYVTATLNQGEATLGGTPRMSAEVLTKYFDYSALGHIHKGYWVVDGKVRYCGSPLQYAIDESENENSVTIVDIKDKGDIKFEVIPLKPLRKVRRLRGNFEDLYNDPIAPQDYVEITLTDEGYIENVMARLREKYPNILQLNFENSRTKTTTDFKTSASSVENRTTYELFKDFYDSMYQVKLEENSDYVEIIKDVCHAIGEE
jgi:exonuclease SbcD